jgi:hypothetical protein
MMTWRDWFFERPRRRVFGWWFFDDAESALMRDDGMRLRFLGPAADDQTLDIRNSGNRRWMRFELRSDTARTAYPLLVERRDVLDPLNSAHRRLVWRLDHIRSAKLRGEQPPERLVWQAVDRVAIDALYCWPDGTRAGLRPAEVAVSGGWRGGEWTTDFYRAFSGSGIGAYPGDGPFPDSPPEPPQRWEMIVPRRIASVEDAQAQFRLLRSAAPHDVAALIPALAQSRPHLRSDGGRLLIPLLISDPRPPMLRWLYVDEALITDRLRSTASSAVPSFAPEWKFSLDSRHCLVGTIDRRTGGYLDFAGVSPGYAERTPRDGALFTEIGHLPSQTLARFREVIGDAVWSWRKVALVLPAEDGVATEVQLGTPAQTEVWPATQYAGTERATTMRAAPGTRHESGRIRLAWMFVDDDGYAPAAREARVGRLDFDGAALAMIDRETGQTLAFERTLDGSADASSDQLGMFRYQHAGIHYPVVVRRTARADPDTGADWVLDHDASADRWLVSPEPRGGEGGRAAAGSKTAAHPPQELWRRVASFAVDALVAWPDTAAFGPAPRAVVAAGGWWGGSWATAIQRRFSTRLLTDVSWRHIREQGLHERFPLLMSGEDPRVVVSGPADPEPTLAWQKHAWPAPARAFGPTTPMITLDPPGAISVDAVDLAAFASERLADRYHWLRDDSSALLYVCGEHKVIRGGPEMTEVMEPLFEYCDEDVRVRLHLSYGSSLEQPVSLAVVHWPRIVRTSRFHERQGVLPASLFRPTPSSKDSWTPQARLWHRLADALEAWLDPAHSGDRAGVIARGLYVAGAFDSSGERKTWLEGGERGRDGF